MSGKERHKLKECLLVIVLASIYVMGTILLSGTFFSGYHLVDDHAIIRRMYMYEHNDMTFYEKCINGFPWLGQRFRPLYIFMYRVKIILLRDNWELWYLWVAIEIIVTLVLAYHVARMMRCKPILSFLFAVIIVTGEQSAIWWRLGPQEPMGLLFLMLCILSLIATIVYHRKAYLYFAFFFSVLSSACKESFVLVLPILPFLVVFFDLFLSEKEISKKQTYEIIKKYLILFIAEWTLFVLEIYLIISKVGILSIGYAGIDIHLGLEGYVEKIVQILRYNMLPYIMVFFLLGMGTIFYLKGQKFSRNNIITNGLLLIIMLVFIGVQLILYAKSGMWERYLVPTSVPIAFIVVVIVNNIIGQNKNLHFIHIVILIVMCGWLFYSKVMPSAIKYAKNGEDIQDFFQTSLLEMPKDAVIVINLDDESNLALESYLELKLDFSNVFSCDKEGKIEDKANASTNVINKIEQADYIVGNLSEPAGYELVGAWGFGKLWKISV